MARTVTLQVDEIEFVKELYPRIREDDAAIERYRAAIDILPEITVARGRVLVDGFHRWQAHRREGVDTIKAEDLGNLTDIEIRKESIQRNSSHGRQLETKDKKRQAGELYLLGVHEDELLDLLSVTEATLETYLRDAKREEKKRRQDWAWDLWLNCVEPADIATQLGFVDKNADGDDRGNASKTVRRWLDKIGSDPRMSNPPGATSSSIWGNIQHFDVWSFAEADDDAGTESFFGRMPPQVVENLLWLYTEPGQIVFDPFTGGGTTIDVAKRMGRRVWASDRKPSTPTLPIHAHDITTGWPYDAPSKVDFILLDPPYWKQAQGRYSDDPEDLGNVTLDEFDAAWSALVKECAGHLRDGGRLAYIISPTQLEDGSVVDHAWQMYSPCLDAGLKPERRVVVTYNTQQATGQQVTWARENKRLLKLYRDLVVFTR